MSASRAVESDELPELGELLDLVFRAPRQITDQHVLTDFPLVFCADNLSRCRVVKQDGKLVSHASLWPRELVYGNETLRAAGVTTVATHPDYRRRGLAVQLMHDLHQIIEQEGIELGILWTAIPDFYERLGWQLVDMRGWLVTCSQPLPMPELPPETQIDRFDAARDLEQLAALHDAEPLRFARSSHQWNTLTNLPKVDLHVLRRADQVAAYAVFSRAVNKPGLIEYAGETADVAVLVSHVSQSHALDQNTPWLIYGCRPDLHQWAMGQGMTVQRLTSSKGPGSEMVYLAQPDRVPDKLLQELFVWGLDHF